MRFSKVCGSKREEAFAHLIPRDTIEARRGDFDASFPTLPREHGVYLKFHPARLDTFKANKRN